MKPKIKIKETVVMLIPMKIQKILCAFPVVNLITVFCWLRLCAKKSLPASAFVKEWLKIALLCLAVMAVRIIFNRMLNDVMIDMILTNVSVFLCCLIISWRSIVAQMKILKSTEQD